PLHFRFDRRSQGRDVEPAKRGQLRRVVLFRVHTGGTRSLQQSRAFPLRSFNFGSIPSSETRQHSVSDFRGTRQEPRETGVLYCRKPAARLLSPALVFESAGEI